MARLVCVLQAVTDTRQYQRELAMLTAREKQRLMDAMERGDRIAWATTEQDGSIMTVTPRLCHG